MRWSLWVAMRTNYLSLLWVLPEFGDSAWNFHGELPAWKPTLPDLDCRGAAVFPTRNAQGLFERLTWDLLRRRVEEAPPENWPALVVEAASLLSVEDAHASLDDWNDPECSNGCLFIAVVRYGTCVGAWSPGGDRSAKPARVAQLLPCSVEDLNRLGELVQRLLHATSIEQFLGTRWPVIEALGSLRLSPYFEDPSLRCEGLANPTLDWAKLRAAFEPAAEWLTEGRPFVYDRGLQSNWIAAMDECTYGFAMTSLWKLVVCAETQAECVSQYSGLIDDLIKSNDWREVAGNSWPMFSFLVRVQKSLMRHEYRLDFRPAELRGEAAGLASGTALLDLEEMQAGRVDAITAAVAGPAGEGGAGSGSNAFTGVLRSILAGIPKTYVSASRGEHGGPEVRSLIYATMVFGPRYVPYIPRFLARASALGIDNLVLHCLDSAAMQACTSTLSSTSKSASSRCLPGKPSILNKFTLPLAYLQLGIDVFWLDFDIFLLQDPTPLVLRLAEARQVDLLVSGSFADDCICSGLVFFRATKVVAEWLLVVISWMYEHTYTHDQQAFSAFLAGRPDEDNATRPEAIAGSKLFRFYMRIEVPRWALLDPVVGFASAWVLNTTGWTGDADDMVIFHFLHGDSEVNRDHNAYGWNSRHGLAGAMMPLLDVFYNQSDERIYYTAERPHRLNVEIKEALLASRRQERPQELLHCGVLQLNPYTPGRLSADG